MEMQLLQILAICGSLRRESSNKELLRAAAQFIAPDVRVTFFEGLAELPHFNPDLDETAQPAVVAWRAQLAAADGMLISSPEYAHSLPGALKNALDWVVGSTDLEFTGKAVALLNASPGSTYGQAALLEVLTVIGANVSAAASIALPLRGRDLTAAAIVAAPELAGPLRAAMLAFVDALRAAAAARLQ